MAPQSTPGRSQRRRQVTRLRQGATMCSAWSACGVRANITRRQCRTRCSSRADLPSRHVRPRPAWPSGESRLRPPEPLERAPTVRACPAARRRAGRHYERQPRYIRPLGEQPSRKFLSTRGGRRGLWVCPAVWLLGSISEHLKAEPAAAQDRERVCTDLTMAFVRWRAGAFTPSGPHSTASDLAPAAPCQRATRPEYSTQQPPWVDPATFARVRLYRASKDQEAADDVTQRAPGSDPAPDR